MRMILQSSCSFAVSHMLKFNGGKTQHTAKRNESTKCKILGVYTLTPPPSIKDTEISEEYTGPNTAGLEELTLSVGV